jgi:hypothetical protein
MNLALTHEFFLIPKTVDITSLIFNGEDIQNYAVDMVEIADDIILYIYDALEWIPSKNPARTGLPVGKGLNYHGFTLFDEQSSSKLKNIFSAWRCLFKNAPDTLKLTGQFVEGIEDTCGDYEIIEFSRDEVINQMDKIIAFAEKINQGEYHLCHRGI